MVQVPPNISVRAGQTGGSAAAYLQNVVEEQARQQWEFYSIETIGVLEEPGCGCIGWLLGWRSQMHSFYVVVFRRPVVATQTTSRPFTPNVLQQQLPSNMDTWDPLFRAAASGDVAQIEALVESGTEVDQEDTKGHTALHFASQYNQAAATEKLLSLGANIDRTTDGGRTAADIARASRASAVLDVLNTWRAAH